MRRICEPDLERHDDRDHGGKAAKVEEKQMEQMTSFRIHSAWCLIGRRLKWFGLLSFPLIHQRVMGRFLRKM
jgi:hypothetical protein